jgi:hypothetical protein
MFQEATVVLVSTPMRGDRLLGEISVNGARISKK